MDDFDPTFSHKARLHFTQASGAPMALAAQDFDLFKPSNPLDLYQREHEALMTDDDGARAYFRIINDDVAGTYNAAILTEIGGAKLVSQLQAHEIPQTGAYRIDYLKIDNEEVDLADLEETTTALSIFLAYKNAAFPNGEGPRALVPRPDTIEAPSDDGPHPDASPAHPSSRSYGTRGRH